MSDRYGHTPGLPPITVCCPRCGQAMRVAPEHVQVAVACPHCGAALEPWRMAETLPPGVAAAASAPFTPVYGPRTPNGELYSSRNRWVAGALGVLLGGFGVHRFYLGFVGIGIVQIVVTLVTCGFGSVWGFIEGILCFCGAMRDAEGLPLRE